MVFVLWDGSRPMGTNSGMLRFECEMSLIDTCVSTLGPQPVVFGRVAETLRGKAWLAEIG